MRAVVGFPPSAARVPLGWLARRLRGWQSLRRGIRPARAATTAISWALVAFATSVAAAKAPEPVWLEGTWVGTWWMGKYEEPVELVLSQRGAALWGRIAMFGYPGAGAREAPMPIEAGWLDGDRLVLVWLNEGRRFTATLSLAAGEMLVGLGGEDGQ